MLLALGLGFALYVYRFQLFGINISVLRVVALILAARAVIVVAMRIFREWRMRWPAAVLLVTVPLVFAINAIDYGSLSEFPSLRVPIGAHLFNMVTALAIIVYLDNERKFTLALKGYVLASALGLWIAYYAYFFGEIPFVFLLREYGSSLSQSLDYLNVNGGIIRLTGAFFDPNFYGIYLLSIAIFSLWLRKYRAGSRWYVLLAVVSVFSILMTASRTAMAGLISAYLVYIFCMSTNKMMHIKLLAVISLCLVTVIIFNASSSRVFDFASVADRFHFYETAWKAFQANVFVGGGSISVLDLASGVATAHMVYLSLLAKYGLLGTGIYLIFVFCPLISIYVFWNETKESYRNLVLLIFIPLAVMYLSYDFLSFLEFEYFLFAIGYAVVVYRFALKPEPTGERDGAVSGLPLNYDGGSVKPG
ncbi:O-antigen ligase family protein [Paraburkholderia sp. A2WS-5]|uniref:O-antigen ligase family protein n=1 Tax=Paraburkholderia sp. A2WS-5 TaxID=3028372 RepID=UPI003B7B8449